MLSQETVTRNAGRACTRSLLPVQSAVDAAEQCLDEQICVESHACVQPARARFLMSGGCASAKERLKRHEPARRARARASATHRHTAQCRRCRAHGGRWRGRRRLCRRRCERSEARRTVRKASQSEVGRAARPTHVPPMPPLPPHRLQLERCVCVCVCVC